MIEITRDNYELFAIDYIEGNLPMDTLIAFEAFLSNNPDIEEELKGLPEFDLNSSQNLPTQENISLKKGSMLSEDINKDNCDFYFAAYHEGDLSPAEKESVDHFLMAFPEKKDDFKQVALLHFKSDETISFPLKGSIKKAVPLTNFQLLLRIAAVFILLLSISLAFLLPKEEKQEYTERNSTIKFPKESVPRDILTFDERKTSRHSGTEDSLVIKDLEVEDVPRYNSPSSNHSGTEDLLVMEEDVPRYNSPSSNHSGTGGEEVPRYDSPSSNHSGTENIEIAVTQDDSPSSNHSGTEDLLVIEDLEVEDVHRYDSPSSNHSGTENIEIGIAQLNEENVPLEENTTNNEIVANTSPEKDDETIFSFKRPFKKQNKDDELLASNDNEPVLKVSNPLKNIRNKSIKIGPFKVKR